HLNSHTTKSPPQPASGVGFTTETSEPRHPHDTKYNGVQEPIQSDRKQTPLWVIILLMTALTALAFLARRDMQESQQQTTSRIDIEGRPKTQTVSKSPDAVGPTQTASTPTPVESESSQDSTGEIKF